MKVKEVIADLQKLNPEIECLMAINKSPGFEVADIVDYYPIESVFEVNLDKKRKDRPKWEGYCEDNDNPEKAVVYVYP
jgi:hypothetical protein